MSESDYSSSGTESDELDLVHGHDETSSDEESVDDFERLHTADELIDVDFQFFDPAENDFFYLKQYMTAYNVDNNKSADFDPSGLAQLILDHLEVGTVVRVGDEPDVYAFATILPLGTAVRTILLKLNCGSSSCRILGPSRWQELSNTCAASSQRVRWRSSMRSSMMNQSQRAY